MLEALPREVAAFYSCEERVVDRTAKCTKHFEALTEQYGFVGGPLEEYAKYFRRSDLPPNMWAFSLEENVKAISGMSKQGVARFAGIPGAWCATRVGSVRPVSEGRW